jgi:hypothetical protein
MQESYKKSDFPKMEVLTRCKEFLKSFSLVFFIYIFYIIIIYYYIIII